MFDRWVKLRSGSSVASDESVETGKTGVLLIKETSSFCKSVIESSRPVVVQVFVSGEDDFFKDGYQSVADGFKGKVAFMRMDRSFMGQIAHAAVSVMGSILARVRSLPLFFFFNNGLLLPFVVVGGTTEKNLVSIINKLFFSGGNAANRSSWSLIRDLGYKIRRCLSSLKVISREVEFYKNSRKWKQRRIVR